MAAPAGTDPVKWDALVVQVRTNVGGSVRAIDNWLNAVWVGMWAGDEQQGNSQVFQALYNALTSLVPDAPTLPRALTMAVV